MGATMEILPYPRRRSSVQLEPMEYHLPGAPTPTPPPITTPQFVGFTRIRLLSSGDEAQPSVSTSPLNPLKIPVTMMGNEKRCRSCEDTADRKRSRSLHPTDRARPVEARQRRRGNLDLEEETTAQFIEKLRKELIAQVNFRPTNILQQD